MSPCRVWTWVRTGSGSAWRPGAGLAATAGADDAEDATPPAATSAATPRAIPMNGPASADPRRRIGRRRDHLLDRLGERGVHVAGRRLGLVRDPQRLALFEHARAGRQVVADGHDDRLAFRVGGGELRHDLGTGCLESRRCRRTPRRRSTPRRSAPPAGRAAPRRPTPRTTRKRRPRRCPRRHRPRTPARRSPRIIRGHA